MNLVFISNNSIGSGLSGGDRIWIELLRNWSKKAGITLICSEEAKAMSNLRGVTAGREIISDTENRSSIKYSIPGLFAHFFRRTRKGLAAVKQNAEIIDSADYVYSCSDAYPDLYPAYLIKKKKPSIKWIAGYYLFAPHPLSSLSPYKGRNWLRGFLYWMMQIPSYRLVNKYADIVFVTSEPDVKMFVNSKRDRSKVVIVQGGVDNEKAESFLASKDVIPVDKRKYDACFLGRFHYQKGVIELVDIWRKVVDKKPSAKLAMIGDGPLEKEVAGLIAKNNLSSNIDLPGFLDGDKKYAVFMNSKMILHPATYDSGGMASAEGMAWRLPGVSFDLESLKTYYPKGMLKAECGNNAEFAKNIIRLLDDARLYEQVAGDARKLILDEWVWSKRADKIYKSVFG